MQHSKSLEAEGMSRREAVGRSLKSRRDAEPTRHDVATSQEQLRRDAGKTLTSWGD